MRRSLLALTTFIFVAGPALAQDPAALPSAATTVTVSGDFGPPCVDVAGCDRHECRPRIWLNAEYLLWWVKDAPMPVPVLTSAPLTSPALIPGALGNPDTTILMGGRNLEYPVRSGARFTAGGWLDAEQTLGVEASYFFLGDRSVSQSFFQPASLTAPNLTNPFFDVAPGAPGESANFLTPGGGAILSSTSRLQGTDVNALRTVVDNGNLRLAVLAGFRYLKLDEGLSFATTQFDTGLLLFPGQFVNTLDQFETRNDFYAGQLGTRIDYTRGRLFLQAAGKLAMGSTHEVVRVNGYTYSNTGPGFLAAIPATTVAGGIYTQPTNIGQQSRDRFAVAPEVTLNIGINLTRHLAGFVGYNFLYLSEVARPGDQIDRTINSTQLTSFSGIPSGPLAGPARPAPLFNGSDFWAQGINFGLNVHW